MTSTLYAVLLTMWTIGVISPSDTRFLHSLYGPVHRVAYSLLNQIRRSSVQDFNEERTLCVNLFKAETKLSYEGDETELKEQRWYV